MSETLTEQTGELPDAENVNDSLLKYYRYNLYSGDFEEFKHCLDTVAPVQLHFMPTATPEVGVAPENIRDQWVGLRLPVRSKQYWEQDDEEGFVVRAREALEILKVERPEAYEWWRSYFIRQRVEENEKRLADYQERYGRPYSFDHWTIDGSHSDPVPENPDFPEYFVNTDWFVFYSRWGVAVPELGFKDALANEPLLRPSTQ